MGQCSLRVSDVTVWMLWMSDRLFGCRMLRISNIVDIRMLKMYSEVVAEAMAAEQKKSWCFFLVLFCAFITHMRPHTGARGSPGGVIGWQLSCEIHIWRPRKTEAKSTGGPVWEATLF